MTEKLLQRPPVKFLYDVVYEIAIVTGFGREIESVCSAVNTRDEKLKFVRLLHGTVQHALHREIDLDPMRVIWGKDPEKTNALLLSLYEAATLVPYRSSEAFRRALNGEPVPQQEEEVELVQSDVTLDESSDSSDDDDEIVSESSSNLSIEVDVSNARVKDMLAKTIKDERRMSELLAEIDVELDNIGDGDDAASRVRQRKAQFNLLKLCASIPVPDDQPDKVKLSEIAVVEDPALACRASRPSATTNATLKEKYDALLTVHENTDRTIVDRETDLLTLLREELSEGWLSYLTSSPATVLIAKHTEERVITALKRLLCSFRAAEEDTPIPTGNVEELQDAVLALMTDDDEDWEEKMLDRFNS
ncbi:hypothetical protein FOL47_007066 [Perkinsus chesapeaki]|uniref:TRAF3-interacting protein 1 N-terminal domain-containing protein n=1 Tax=Perkinsus chesapeaki TaxID=330153 RepID=A0A7J6LN04_PERCH|nr:hypothetical protein FOL47_007066 [Perkinsus chesapeaki]